MYSCFIVQFMCPNSLCVYLIYDVCKENWWTNVVYVANYIGNCQGSFWSISVEVQLYILSAIPMYFYLKDKRSGVIATALFIVIPTVLRAIFTYRFSYDGMFSPYLSWVYLNTFTRADTYGVGIMCYIIYDCHMMGKPTSLSSKLFESFDAPPKWAVLLLWFIGVLSVLLSIYLMFFPFHGPWWWPGTSYGLSDMFLFTPLSLGTGWMILASLDGSISCLTRFMSSKYWYPISMLSYTSYLWSEAVFVFYRSAAYIENDLGFIFWYSVCCGTISIVAFLTTILIEKPFMTFGKRLNDRWIGK